MEADENGVTAKNTYGGPLLLRTVFHEDGSEETYQYLYNAHGDVVTLLSEGEVKATYYYDSFGNILEQTGEVDNSILYAGYQYDEETGLYYINARMYDPVTARFLQADTYLGNLNDPLSLNLYTYCLNNPHKYADPSGHSVILALLLVAVVSFAVGARMEYVNQKYIEKRDIINYDLILFEGVFNAVIAVVSFGTANIGVAAARQGARSVARSTGRAVARTMAFGAAEGAANSIGRQLVEGKTLSEIDFGQVAFDTTLNAVTAGISGYHGANKEIFDNARKATKGNVRKNALLNVDADDVADMGTPNGHVKVESGSTTVNNGATRAAKYSSEWGDASLNEAINRFTPNVEPVTTPKGKIIYNNSETGISVVYDKYGNYFRIEDTARPRGRNYLDIYGNDMNNEIVNGKTRGRSTADYQRVTHFNNSDR